MYAILSTWPKHSDGNVGDKLLEEQCKHLIEKETGVSEFEVYFQTRDFTSHVEKLNEADAVILPACVVRDSAGEPHGRHGPMYPGRYTLAENLDEIETPLVPLGMNWQTYPGDSVGNKSIQYSAGTVSLLKFLYNQPELSQFTAQDIYTRNILQRHGFDNTTLVGDLGWYQDDYIGQEMRVPTSIDHIVMTTPHRSHYEAQAKRLMDVVTEEFPGADVTLSFHSRVNLPHEKNLRNAAERRGFDIVHASHYTENIAFYDDCDLHVGYRLHGHLSFLRRRLPSVLLGEDGRGNGFNATLGTAGFPAMDRRLGPRVTKGVNDFAETYAGKGMKSIASQFVDQPIRRLIAPPDESAPEKVRAFLRQEQANNFASYEAVSDLFDTTYEGAMQPFLKSLPQ
jgi:hypothetical protein